MKNYNISAYEANILVSEKEISDYYEEVIKQADKKLAANWIMGDLFAVLNKKIFPLRDHLLVTKNLSILINLISSEVNFWKNCKSKFLKL